MQIKTIAIAAAAGGALLWAGTLITKTGPIEAKLTKTTEIVLADAGFKNLRVEYSGRDAHIYGGPELNAHKSEIRKHVKDIWGVRVARLHFGDQYASNNAAAGQGSDNSGNESGNNADSNASAASGNTNTPLAQASAALQASHFQDLSVTIDGKTATISGPSPGVLEEEQALEIVGGVNGIDDVRGNFSSASGKAITAEARATARACALAINSTLAIGRIQFASGSAELSQKSFPLLDRLANETLKCADAVIQINGHTDSSGSDQINQPLSADRAASVAKYLASKGLESERLTTNGYGSSRPIASNDTAEGRAQNRRIEFRVIL